MGNPLEYKGFSFIHFLENTSIEYMSQYAEKMEQLFKENCQQTQFLANEFIKVFQGHFNDYDPQNGISYEFQTTTDETVENWRFYLRFTQISHIEGGVVSTSSKDRLPPIFSLKFLEKKLASVIIYAKLLPMKGFRSFFARDISIINSGTKRNLYIFLKVMRSRILLEKYMWQPNTGEEVKFNDFIKRLETICEDDSEKIITLPCSVKDKKIVAELTQPFDTQMQKQLTVNELDSLFDLIKISPEEWLSTN